MERKRLYEYYDHGIQRFDAVVWQTVRPTDVSEEPAAFFFKVILQLEDKQQFPIKRWSLDTKYTRRHIPEEGHRLRNSNLTKLL
jgi:hypothetical protein